MEQNNKNNETIKNLDFLKRKKNHNNNITNITQDNKEDIKNITQDNNSFKKDIQWDSNQEKKINPNNIQGNFQDSSIKEKVESNRLVNKDNNIKNSLDKNKDNKPKSNNLKWFFEDSLIKQKRQLENITNENEKKDIENRIQKATNDKNITFDKIKENPDIFLQAKLEEKNWRKLKDNEIEQLKVAKNNLWNLEKEKKELKWLWAAIKKKIEKKINDNDAIEKLKKGISNIKEKSSHLDDSINSKKKEVIINKYNALKSSLPKNLWKVVDTETDLIEFRNKYSSFFKEDDIKKIEELWKLQKQYHFSWIKTKDKNLEIKETQEKINLYEKSLNQYVSNIEKDIEKRIEVRNEAEKKGDIEKVKELDKEIDIYEVLVQKLSEKDSSVVSDSDKKWIIGILNSNSWLQKYNKEKLGLWENPNNLFNNTKWLEKEELINVKDDYKKIFKDYVVSNKINLLENFSLLKSTVKGWSNINLKTDLWKFIEDNKKYLSEDDILKIRKLKWIKNKISNFTKNVTNTKNSFLDNTLKERKLKIEEEKNEILVLDQKISNWQEGLDSIKNKLELSKETFSKIEKPTKEQIEEHNNEKQVLQNQYEAKKNEIKKYKEERSLGLNHIKKRTEEIGKFEENINKILDDNLLDFNNANKYINNYWVASKKEEYWNILNTIEDDIKSWRWVAFWLNIDLDKSLDNDAFLERKNLDKLKEDKKILRSNRVEVVKDFLSNNDSKEKIYERHEKIDSFLYWDKQYQSDGTFKREWWLLWTWILGLFIGIYILLDKMNKGTSNLPILVKKIEKEIHNNRIMIFFGISFLILLSIMTSDRIIGNLTILNPNLFLLWEKEIWLLWNNDIVYANDSIKKIVENISLFINFMWFIVLYQILIDFLFNYIKLLKTNIQWIMWWIFFSFFKIIIFIVFFWMLFTVSNI